MANQRKRPSRLGRGLSSLMAQSVPATPPDESPAEPAAPETSVDDAATHPAAPETALPSQQNTTPPGHDRVDRPDEAEAPADEDAETVEGAGTTLHYIPLEQLHPNPHQPRKAFDESALKRLAESIKSDGLMQPIVVRPAGADDGQKQGNQPAYEIVAGERRWRAARLANLTHVPAILRELDDRALAEWALIENLQREDLNPIERGEAFQRLAERFGLGHEEIAGRVGLDRSTITNLLRLLGLSDNVKEHVRHNRLSMGQARAIAGVGDPAQQQRIADRAVKQGLSVRQVEQLARDAAVDPNAGSNDVHTPSTDEPSSKQIRSAYLADLERTISEQLQTKVKVQRGRKKGTGSLTIEFYSLDQFDALLQKLGVKAE